MKATIFTKKRTRQLCMVLLLGMLVTILIACRNKGDSSVEIEPLDSELLAEVKAGCAEMHGNAELLYYGTYNGCVVVRNEGVLQAFREVEVAGITFEFPTISYMIVWKDGECFYLQEAYDQGLLTKKQLQIISTIQNEKRYIELKQGE